MERQRHPYPYPVGLRRRRRATLLYPDPATYLTAEDFARARHVDIAELDDAALDDERLLARLRRACDPSPSVWLRERIARLEAEAARRRGRPRNAR